MTDVKLTALNDEICLEAEKLVKLLEKKKMKIAAAESLTGGTLSGTITSISGASAVLECGVCSYSNRIKHELLSVSENTLEQFTEYSIETACEMAQGVRLLSSADIGISTTGIAGPSGGTDEKPVGYVCIGISTAAKTFAKDFVFGSQSGNERQLIRMLTVKEALSMALKELSDSD